MTVVPRRQARAVAWAAVLGMACSAAHAQQTFGPSSVAPAARDFRIGTLKLTALHDAQLVLPNDAKIFGGDAGVAAVSDLLRNAGAPTDRITLSVNALVVHSGKRLLLLDTGLGANHQGSLLASLHAAGIAPNAITDVLITHSHGDHIGGLVDVDGHLTFPKATIRLATAEWQWLQQQGPAALVSTVTPRVKTFEPGATLAPGVRAIALDGHTPGHVGYEVASGRTRLLDVGDLAHSSIISLAKPEWKMGFDSDASIAAATRQQTLAALAKDDEWVFAPHFPFPGVGHIIVAGSALAWKAEVP